MTPEQQAEAVVADYHATRCWGYDPGQHAEYITRLASAIRDAVKAERERWATAAEAAYEAAPDDEFNDLSSPPYCSGFRDGCAYVAKLVRTPEPPP